MKSKSVNMPNETSQPFDQTQRDPRDERLVGQVLGPDAVAEMKVLVDEQTKLSRPKGKLELTEGEAVVTKKAEQEVTAEQRRQQYYNWAENIGKDEYWVDDTFTFNIDGTVIIEGDVILYNFGIDVLPPKLIEVTGYINLANNQITSLEGMPSTIGDGLYLGNNQIISLKGLPDVVHGFLSLNENQTLTSLNGLPKKIDGNLNLVNIPATSIPEGLDITGKIYLSPSQTELIADCQAKGYEVEVML